MNAAEILLVDDEAQIRRVLRTMLSANGYAVLEAGNGDEALEKIHGSRVDLILLDVNMPGLSGVEVCRRMRLERIDVPIIMLTVRNAERDKVEALDAGADDYVAKPFGSEELLARIRAALRRVPANDAPTQFTSGNLSIDFDRREVTAGERTEHLTPKEFELLRVLIAHRGKVMSHRKLLQTVWGPEYGNEAEYLRVFINQLRKKVEPDSKHPRYIQTIPAVGYRFDG